MFLDLTSTLTLDKIQVSLLSIDEPSRDFTISTVDEVLVPITCKDTIFTPDFSATGFFMQSPSGKPRFIFGNLPSSTHIMYITGLPREEMINPKFRFKQVDFVSYWEDNQVGYLTQIIKK